MTKIAIDGMGGDYAPRVVVDGTVQAANDFDYELVLVGQEAALKRELVRHKVTAGRLSIQHASEVIDMSDSPVSAIKKKKDSSLAVCVELLRKKEIDAIVTAGNTGAAVAACTLNLGLLSGIKRPGIAIAVPTLQGISLAMDVGANIAPSPEHLLQYGYMSDVYSRYIFKKRRPTIGLLNVGEEESKGTDVLKETYRMLRESDLNFIGNIEGRDFFSGKCDCVICDGFVGNVILKVVESMAETAIGLFKKEIDKNFVAKIGALLCKPALMAIRKDTNYEEAGGAPLLGISGICFISHGGSSAKAIRNAIKAAGNAVEQKVNYHIVNDIAQKNKEAKEKQS